MKKTQIYKKNLGLFAKQNPSVCLQIEKGISKIKFCYTSEDELNLVDSSQQDPVYYYANAGARWEARCWSRSQPLSDVNALFVYGIGLGYYYEPLKNWLTKTNNHLVFIESNPEIIHCFLQTELATEILSHPQIFVILCPFLTDLQGKSLIESEEKFRVSLSPFLAYFANSQSQISALQAYFVKDSNFFNHFNAWLRLFLSEAKAKRAECLDDTYSLFKNLYSNLPYLSEAVRADKMGDDLSSIPTILCGAGPSLAKQIPLLKTVKDNALIFASGSAMNALTKSMIIPHGCGGYDPHLTQVSRLMTSFAFNVPLFYQERFNAEALIQWHGPHIYVKGSKRFRVSEWFEKKIGISNEEDLTIGTSTSIFLLELLNFLKINSIILLGMDLAYTHDVRYAEGVIAHPTDTLEEQKGIHDKDLNLFKVEGLNGEVYTKNSWLLEAGDFSLFKEQRNSIQLINATEGGMPIELIPNISFQKAIEHLPDGERDIEGYLHGVIQNASKDKINHETLMKAFDEWLYQLKEACEILCQIENEFSCQNNAPNCDNEKQIISLFAKLRNKEIYLYLLHHYEEFFNNDQWLHLRSIHALADENERKALLKKIERERGLFLLAYCQDHIQKIDCSLQNYHWRQKALAKIVDGCLILDQPHPNPKLTTTNQGESKVHYYASGAIKIRSFLLKKRLHGPWKFYSENNVLLVHSHYSEGKKEGQQFLYYYEGMLFSLQNYVDGLKQGLQTYYYPNGRLKTAENYQTGKFHGTTTLYYINGQRKKEINFLNGLLHGQEKLWNEEGRLILEAYYSQDNPIGIARRWDHEGNLLKEVNHEKIIP